MAATRIRFEGRTHPGSSGGALFGKAAANTPYRLVGLHQGEGEEKWAVPIDQIVKSIKEFDLAYRIIADDDPPAPLHQAASITERELDRLIKVSDSLLDRENIVSTFFPQTGIDGRGELNKLVHLILYRSEDLLHACLDRLKEMSFECVGGDELVAIRQRLLNDNGLSKTAVWQLGQRSWPDEGSTESEWLNEVYGQVDSLRPSIGGKLCLEMNGLFSSKETMEREVRHLAGLARRLEADFHLQKRPWEPENLQILFTLRFTSEDDLAIGRRVRELWSTEQRKTPWLGGFVVLQPVKSNHLNGWVQNLTTFLALPHDKVQELVINALPDGRPARPLREVAGEINPPLRQLIVQSPAFAAPSP
jgi:hypothetical protein